jgi:hypothetical protein
MFIGIALIVIGVVFLLQNLGLVSSDAWQIIWPTLIIIFGLCMMSRTASDHCRGKKEKKEAESKK